MVLVDKVANQLLLGHKAAPQRSSSMTKLPLLKVAVEADMHTVTLLDLAALVMYKAVQVGQVFFKHLDVQVALVAVKAVVSAHRLVTEHGVAQANQASTVVAVQVEVGKQAAHATPVATVATATSGSFTMTQEKRKRGA